MSTTRASVVRETARRVRRLNLRAGEDIRRLRLDAGLGSTELAHVVGVHRSHLARIESGTASPSIKVLTAIGVALGADLGVRYFAGSGPRLHDRFQAPMIEAVLTSLDRRWTAELEVPVAEPARGVIDLVVRDRASQVIVAAEAQSELRRLEQQLRWSNEKAHGLGQRLAHDGDAGPEASSAPVVSRLLILRSTVTTRELARRYEAILSAAYPARTEDIISALTTASAPWPGAGIVWIRITGADVTLLRHPPRGVTLGR